MSESSASLDKLKGTYPHDVQMSDGTAANLRLFSREDKDAIVEFAGNLPTDDLLFLRVDITEPAVVDNWINNVESGSTISIVAYDDEGVAGYATVDRTPAR